MLVGSIATGLSSCGGFCAGSNIVVNHQVRSCSYKHVTRSQVIVHQRINGTSFVFSAAMPAVLTVAASEGISILRSTPSILSTLQENVRAVRAVLDRVDCIAIPSHPASAVIHLQIRWPTLQIPGPATSSPGKPSNPLSVKPRDPPQFNIELEEKLLQDIVDEALAQGILVTRAKRLHGQELVEVRPSIRLAITAALSRKDCEKAASVVKAAFVKVIGKRR